MKIFTHTFNVTVFEEGKFCWKNPRWVKGGLKDCFFSAVKTAIVILLLFSLINAFAV